MPTKALGRVCVQMVILAALLTSTVPALAHDTSFEFKSFPQDPAVTEFSSSFGAVRSEGRRHQGNDLMAPKMTPVYAVADGTVLSLKHSTRAGWYIRLGHKGDWETWYIHLNNDRPGTDDGRAKQSQIFAKGLEVGDEVVAGRVIGYVGDSGNAEPSSSHTHFELHHRGRIVNPYPYLVDAQKAHIKRLKKEAKEAYETFLSSNNIA